MFTKSSLKKFCIVALCCVILFLFFVLVSPLILLSLEDNILKDQLDNPYVNSEFCDWETETIEEFGTFKLPDMWSLHQDTNPYHITDTSGETIAYATIFDVDGEPFEDYSAFLSSFLGYTPVDFSMEHISEFVSINASSFGALTISKNDSDEELFYLSLYGPSSSEVLFVFLCEEKTQNHILLEIAQAISYSVNRN